VNFAIRLHATVSLLRLKCIVILFACKTRLGRDNGKFKSRNTNEIFLLIEII